MRFYERLSVVISNGMMAVNVPSSVKAVFAQGCPEKVVKLADRVWSKLEQ